MSINSSTALSENDPSAFRILIVEDTPETAERLTLTIRRVLESAEIQHRSDFSLALSDLDSPHPFEAIVLDLYLGVPEADNKQGQKIWEQIWANKFLPVIIYTAGDCAELEPPVPIDNPFVTCINKGDANSDEKVAEYLTTIRPYMIDLREVEEDLSRAVRSVLSKTSPVIWNSTDTDTTKRSELLVRSTRRRLAAAMDMKTESTEQVMYSWEQYIYPPLEESLLTGDVLLATGDAVGEGTAYRLVLTPSCDLQMNNGKCKVKEVLVAKCGAIGRYTGAIMSALKLKKDKLPEFLSRLLSEPHQGGFIPLPAYGEVIPDMAASLRDLELISVEDIDAWEATGRAYKRVASVDSPFREFITWAYLQIIGRPGMPDRDLDRWAEEIINPRGSAAGTRLAAPTLAVPLAAKQPHASEQEKNRGKKKEMTKGE